MKKKWKLIGGALAAFACILSSCVNASPSSSQERKLTPKYLLTGTLTSSDEIFDYYLTGQDTDGYDEYAISLKSSLKETFTGDHGTITIPSTYPGNSNCKITGIWHDAFHKNPASGIAFQSPSYIRTIDFEAFMYSGITSITIPYTVSEMGDGAFYACPNLTKVVFVNSNQESTGTATDCSCDDCVDEDEGDDDDDEQSSGEQPAVYYSELTTIPSLCFFKCNSLGDLSLPSSIEEICEEAFNGCYNLRSDLFFQRIKIIRSRAFQGCTSISNVYISKSLFADVNNIGIEPHAFNYCDPELTFKFCGAQEDVENWVDNHPTWGWRVDRDDPTVAGNSYGYDLTTGDNFFTADWTYTVDEYNNVTITKFNGTAADITKGFISIPDHMPEPVGNKVIYISRTAFDNDVKAVLKRLYLPKTLMSVANWMFFPDTGSTGYSQLYVIDDNSACATDYSKADADIEGRIDLSGLKDLEFIGVRAFAGIGDGGSPKARTKIKSLHLPSKLKAIGGEAFGIFNKRCLPSVTEFIWDYSEADSILETIGTDAFYGLGIGTTGAETGQITQNSTRKKHTASTIIFPKTFKYFGMLPNDINRYKSQATNKFWFDEAAPGRDTGKGEFKPEKEARPSHAFAGCSLLKKVVFKGSSNSGDTTDLVIPLQTFVYNESLQTIIFEGRPGHAITFHTQQGRTQNNDYAQEAIGGNSGRGRNDFRGEPFLQTLVLPNKDTIIRVQDFAFHANSRAAIYFSGSDGQNLYSDNVNGHWKDCANANPTTFENADISLAYQWKTIGNEEYYQAANNPSYYGYCFAPTASSRSSDASLNTFSIEQETPCYYNVHYVDEETGAEVGSDNTKHYVLKDNCSYVCEKVGDDYIATMTKYHYNLFDQTTGDLLPKASVQTAEILSSVTVSGQSYSVTKIGDSAFSACYCDKKSEGTTVASDNELTTVVMPDTITHIGEYAFIRAYGIKTIKSYTGNKNTATERMPKDLRHIGKNAFLFSGISKILEIPYECKFYENENQTYKITSVFANDLSLRKITFLNSAGNDTATESKYYSTTTYTPSADASEKYTTAVYSKNENGIYNADRLLVVLNRDKSDNKKPSTDAAVNTADTGLRFNGQIKTNPFLFGAYKMGCWIKELVIGSPTVDAENKKIVQPLFSPIGDRKANSNLVDKPFYLGQNGSSGNNNNDILYTRDDFKQDLTTITGDVLKMPEYALNGCDQLTRVELPDETNGEIPSGLFANVTKTDTNYVTGGSEGSTVGVLDLSGTGYKKINKDAFKNNASLTKFIAPNVANFTIDTSAFDSCANLATLDFSGVTGSLIINGTAFNNTKVSSITWPSSPCTVTINDSGAFKNCKSLVTLSLPSTLQKLGKNAFEGCTALTTVDTVGGATVGITHIYDSAFSGCTSLEHFPFDKLTSLTTIGVSAFFGAGKVDNNGDIVLPQTGTFYINKTGFSTSKITSIKINASTISFGESAFENCTSLTAVIFTNHGCGWYNNTYNASVFNGCTALTELQLPTGFNLNNTSYSATKHFIYGDTNINIYAYEKFSSNAAANEYWRKISNETVPVHYFVDDVQDLIDANVITNTPEAAVMNNSTLFWTIDANGRAINLGNVVSYDGYVVTFDNGSTLSGSTFTH